MELNDHKYSALKLFAFYPATAPHSLAPFKTDLCL